MEIGQYRAANKALDLVDAATPRLPQTLKIRVNAARALKDAPAIEAAARVWLEVEPDNEEPRIALAWALAEQGYYARAAETYRPLAEKDDPKAEHIAAMGRYKLGARAVDEAISLFERALAVDAKCAEAHFGLARAYTFKGDLAAAEKASRATIAADETRVDAYAQLAEIVRGRLTEAEFAKLRKLSEAPDIEPGFRAAAHFAMGDALHRAELRKEAFDAWSKAKSIKAAEARKSPHGAYDPRAQERKTARLKALFPQDSNLAEDVFRREGEPVPIFIVGMPRSGTTLLESALNAHPTIAGGGELPSMPFLLKETLAAAKGDRPVRLTDETVALFRGKYFRQVDDFGLRRTPYLADKQPQNFEAIGLIRAVFPEAKIVHIRRKPLETGFSIFRRNFSAQWPFAHDLASIGHYYGQYADLMAHWESAYPGALAFVQYEDFVENFESELKRILEWCGLPWDEACLNFHDADRPVVTFSATQVRKPPSKEHFGAAEPYRDFLEPLRDALIEAGVDLETGARRTQHGDDDES
jgi:tetratricopeptide (TPR) repeat protein